MAETVAVADEPLAAGQQADEPAAAEVAAREVAVPTLDGTERVAATPPDASIEVSTDAPGELVVWSPFYSEASARGFAGRLVRELEVPFEVRKAGPSQYLVTASYRDDRERSAIEARVAGMTGGAPQ